MNIVVNAFYAAGFKVGFNRFTHNFLNMISKFDNSNSYIVFIPINKHNIPEIVIKNLKSNKNIEIIYIDNVLKQNNFEKEIINYCEKNVNKIDYCIHLYPVNIKKNLKFKNHIITVHDLIPFETSSIKNIIKNPQLINGLSLSSKKDIKKIMSNSNNCKLILTVSNYSKNMIEKYYPILKNNIKVLYNIINIDKSNSQNTVSNQYNDIFEKYKNKEYIFYFGGASNRKNVDIIFKSFNRIDIDKCPYFLISCHKEDIPKFNKLLDKNHNNKVIYLDKLNDNDIYHFGKSASLYIYMSLAEGFGLPPIEIQRLKTPTIVHKISSLPEVCGDGSYYVNNKINELKEAIINILDNKKLSNDLSHKGYINSIRFSEENIYTQYKEILTFIRN